MIFFSQITAATETAKKIQAFVEGELVTILSTMGEIEFKAAAAALKNISLSRAPSNQVLLAIGHLQSAHMAYRGIYSESKGWKDYFTLATRMAALQKDVFTLCLTAICYKYLGETELMQDSLRLALEAIKPWTRLSAGYTLGELTDPKKLKACLTDVASAVGSWANKGSWPVMVQMARGEFPEVKEEEILQLCKFLKWKPPLTPKVPV